VSKLAYEKLFFKSTLGVIDMVFISLEHYIEASVTGPAILLDRLVFIYVLGTIGVFLVVFNVIC